MKAMDFMHLAVQFIQYILSIIIYIELWLSIRVQTNANTTVLLYMYLWWMCDSSYQNSKLQHEHIEVVWKSDTEQELFLFHCKQKKQCL